MTDENEPRSPDTAEEVSAAEAVRKALFQRDLPFSEFMELSLYSPARGYYDRSIDPVSGRHDYITSVEISPVFAWALGRLATEFVQRAGDGLCAIVDIGCGRGTMLRGIIESMSPAERDRSLFWGVDRSLARLDSALAERDDTHFTSDPASLPWDVPLLVFSNELYDAFPFARLVMHDGRLRELMVTLAGDDLGWSDRPAPEEYADYFARRGLQLEEGQYADVSLAWERSYSAIASRIQRGMIVTIDYGAEETKLFHPRFRRFGTAAAFSGHRVSRDLLQQPGEQDLTAHINFTDLRRAGESCGLVTLLFTKQARFLLSLGITGHPLFGGAGEGSGDGRAALTDLDARRAAQRLILPDGIGEEMSVLVQSTSDFAGVSWCFLRQMV
ncbi:MAG TPA: SAM-dependent methyltransferase [Thermoanaerobaculia bacterium]|nr:SAM-dependent methyltransferase [Thermoanaerobaculia bacterium]